MGVVILLYEAIILSLVLSLLTKGNIRNLSELKLKGIGLIFLAFLLKYGLEHFALKGYVFSLSIVIIVQFLNYLFLFIFIYLNFSTPGIKLISLGFLMNFTVIMVNGGSMPATLDGVNVEFANLIEQNLLPTYSVVDIHTKLPFLADIFLQTFPEHKKFSIGDVFISIGVFYLVWVVMHTKNKVKNYRLESFLTK